MSMWAQNPFNGIERITVDGRDVRIMIDLNPFNGIERRRLASPTAQRDVRIHSMELKGNHPASCSTGLWAPPESIQWNWKTKVTIMSDVPCGTSESIQWNWKTGAPPPWTRREDREESIQWNWKVLWWGLPSTSRASYESIQWNWKRPSAMTVLYTPSIGPRIHSMELKGGIGRQPPPVRPIETESIQWNWKLVDGDVAWRII